jgi:hypothetical protein
MRDKYCPRCQRVLSLSCFGTNKNGKSSSAGLQSYCTECNRAYDRARYAARRSEYRAKETARRERVRRDSRKRVIEYLLQHPCADCGETDYVVLEFDHNDPREKSYEVSDMVGRGFSWRRIEEEIAKCTVRCAHCHKRRTAKQRGWYQ